MSCARWPTHWVSRSRRCSSKPAGAPSDAAESTTGGTEAAIRADPLLSDAQKEALLAVYGSYVAEARRREEADAG